MADKLQFTMTEAGLLIYPNVIEPKAFGQNPKPDAKKSYSCSFVLGPDHPDLKTIKAMLGKAAKAEWPSMNVNEEWKAGRLNLPLVDGTKYVEQRALRLKAAGKEDDHALDVCKGQSVLKSGSDYPTALAVVTGQGRVDVTDQNRQLHKNAFYSGVHGCGQFSFKAYTVSGNRGVKVYLDAVLSFNTGAIIKTSGKSAATVFSGVAGKPVDESVSGDELSDADGF